MRRDALLNNVKRRGEYEATGLYDDRMKSERMVGVRPRTFRDDSHNCRHISKIQTLAGLEGITLNARSTISEYKVWLLERQVQLMDARYNPKH